tara:strand:- start:2328 stop:2591 length:264 start_codon:yes stop_codon:yes gene_type:complete
MAYSNLTNPGNYQLASFGQKGFKRVVSGTAAPAGHYNSILVLEDVVLTCASVNGDGLSTEEVPAGVTIVGMFTAISVSSGVALAYIA